MRQEDRNSAIISLSPRYLSMNLELFWCSSNNPVESFSDRRPTNLKSCFRQGSSDDPFFNGRSANKKGADCPYHEIQKFF